MGHPGLVRGICISSQLSGDALIKLLLVDSKPRNILWEPLAWREQNRENKAPRGLALLSLKETTYGNSSVFLDASCSALHSHSPICLEHSSFSPLSFLSVLPLFAWLTIIHLSTICLYNVCAFFFLKQL